MTESEPTTATERDAASLRQQQLSLLFKQLPLAFAGTAVAALVYAGFAYNYVSTLWLSVWLAALLGVTALRYGHVLAYRRTASPDTAQWENATVLGSAVSGLIWGGVALAAYPAESLPHQTFLALIAGGLGAGTLATCFAVRRAAAAFIVLSLTPIAARFLWHGDPLHLGMGAMIAVFLIILLPSLRRVHENVLQSLRLNLENRTLVDYLAEAKHQQELLNQELREEIVQRKQAETDLRESEARYRVLSDSSFEGIAIHENGMILDANEKLAELLGYERYELIGKTAFDLVQPQFHRAIRERLADPNAEPLEVLARRRDGSSMPAELRGKNIPYKGQQVRVVSVRDLSSHKQAEERLRRSQKDLGAILDNMQDTFYRTNRSGEFIMVSPSVQTLLGFAPEELIGRPLSELYVAPGERSRFLERLNANGGAVTGFEAALRHKDGHAVWVSTSSHYYYDEFGNILGVEGTTRDITDLKHAREALQAEKERALVTLESIGDGVITTDTDHRVQYLNPVAETLTGWDNERARGKPLSEVFAVVDESTGEPLGDALSFSDEQRVASNPYRPILLRGQNERNASIDFTGSYIRGDDGDPIGCVVVFRDVSELRRMERALSHQATHDSLTGLINRYEFESRLEALLDDTRHTGQNHALCYLDLDQFKVVNDTCGHVAGDELLTQLAAQLQEKTRATDTLARLGGDEFGILLEGCPIDKAKRIAEELSQIVREFRFAWGGRVFEVGVSTGLVPITEQIGSITDALSAADSACYVAKDHGGNRVHVYQTDDWALAQRHGEMQWLQRTKAALQEGRLALYTQRAQAIESHLPQPLYREILVRMVGEDQRLVSPKEFIPAAERYHLMPEVDRWVLNATLDALQEARDEITEDTVFAVNLSGQSLCQREFLDFAVDAFARFDVPPKNLCFEVTETAAISNLTHARRFIEVLKGMECRFALDDFGSGLSSFAYLKDLPVDFLKIDGAFVADIVEDPVNRSLVHTINQVGHLMGKKTIAEFVTSRPILDVLSELGVDYAQGFFIERPGPFTMNCAPLPPHVPAAENSRTSNEPAGGTH